MFYLLVIPFFTFLLSPVIAAEQSGQLSNIQQLTQDNNSIAPVFSPTDTTLLAFTRQKYQGIYLLRTQTGVRSLAVQVNELTDNKQAGFGFAWAGDKIVSRFEVAGKKQVGTIEVSSKKYTALSEQAVELSVPTVYERGVFFTQNKAAVDLPNDRLRSQSVTEKLTVFEQDGQIIVNDRPVNFPNTECWLPTLSPDAQKVSFECWQGIYVYAIQQNKSFYLGRGGSVSWLPNSLQLLHEVTEDNGVIITQSDIILVNYDGSHPTNLTQNTDIIARRPSINHDSRQIAFDDGDNLFLADLVK